MNTQNEKFNLTGTGIETMIFAMRPFCKIQEGNIMGNTYRAFGIALLMQKALIDTLIKNSAVNAVEAITLIQIHNDMIDDFNKFKEQNKF